MTTATISAFERTLQKTNIWLKDLLSELHWEESDHERSYHALRAVLHALRDRLSAEEATDLAAQLPMLIRGFYFEGWKPSRKPLHIHRKDEFLEHVAELFANDLTADVEAMTRATFKVMNKHITAGEIDDVKSSLPGPIRELWD